MRRRSNTGPGLDRLWPRSRRGYGQAGYTRSSWLYLPRRISRSGRKRSSTRPNESTGTASRRHRSGTACARPAVAPIAPSSDWATAATDSEDRRRSSARCLVLIRPRDSRRSARSNPRHSVPTGCLRRSSSRPIRPRASVHRRYRCTCEPYAATRSGNGPRQGNARRWARTARRTTGPWALSARQRCQAVRSDSVGPLLTRALDVLLVLDTEVGQLPLVVRPIVGVALPQVRVPLPCPGQRTDKHDGYRADDQD